MWQWISHLRGFERLPDHVVALAGADVHRVSQEARRDRHVWPSRATTANGPRECVSDE